MKISIIAVGRLKKGPEVTLYDRYAERIRNAGRGVGIGPLLLTEIAEASGGNQALRCSAEAGKILEHAGKSDYLIALDEGGRSLTSRAFSDLLAKARDGGAGLMTFMIGGADGHGAEVGKRARLSLSMSDMTLPHGLARIVLVEQIYRAITIMSGHPYHRD